jgi:hypothetical protein
MPRIDNAKKINNTRLLACLVTFYLLSLSLPCSAASQLSTTESLPSMFQSTETVSTASLHTNSSYQVQQQQSYTIDYAWSRMTGGSNNNGGYYYDLVGPYLHGWSLALNLDGSVVAVGSILSNGPFGGAVRSGMVTIYQWSSEQQQQQQANNATTLNDSYNGTLSPSTWTQWQTTQLYGLNAGDQCGYSVSLDGTGTILGESLLDLM